FVKVTQHKTTACFITDFIYTVFFSSTLEDLQVDHRNILVSRGDSISLTCNISMKNATQINWTKDKKNIFTSSIKYNQTFSNFTSHRLRIETDSPTQLNISNAQHDDSGLYTCNVIARYGPQDIVWNLTVSQSLDGSICHLIFCRNYSIMAFSIHTRTCNWISSMQLDGSCLHLQVIYEQKNSTLFSCGAEHLLTTRTEADLMKKLYRYYVCSYLNGHFTQTAKFWFTPSESCHLGFMDQISVYICLHPINSFKPTRAPAIYFAKLFFNTCRIR
uniref:Ig-like domain-containing protein n=1 Tax=Mastacembelus armatus TaxID=205130 RepID=A0A3Q3MGA3_9TELE